MNQILTEVKKAIDLWLDKTYNESEFYSHILQICNDAGGQAEQHRDQLERLIFKTEEMRELQRLYHAGHKSKLSACKAAEMEMDKKLMALKTHKGYNTERFKKTVKQEGLF